MAGNKTLGFRRHVQVYIVDDGKLLLRGKTSTHILNDVVYKALAPLLDVTRTDDEIVAELLDDYPAENLYYALLRLQSKGHVVEFDHDLSGSEIAFWHGAGMDASHVVERRNSRRLAITAVADLPKQTLLESMLVDNGITLSEPEAAFLIVVLTDDYLKIDEVAQNLFTVGTPWLPVCLGGGQTWVGPCFTTHSIQWRYLKRCLEQNLHAALLRQNAGSRELFRPYPPSIKSCRDLDLFFAATEITRHLMTDENRLECQLVAFDAIANRTENHPVPDADTLSAFESRFQSIRNESQIKLRSRPKRFYQDGGFRSELPDTTLSQIEPFISSTSGVVPPIKRLGSDKSVHVFVTREPVAGASFAAVGKGVSITQAKVSCYAEAFERYCAQFRGDEPRKLMHCDRTGTEAIRPEKVLNFSERQYLTREDWNDQHRGFNWIPERFDESVAIEWTPAWSLSRDERRWLPTAYCYHRYSIPSGPEFCLGDSNGCAAGNNREEAVLQGLFELLERDAAAIWWYNRLPRPRVDLAARRDTYVDEVLAFHDRIGRDVSALDITTDLGIPVIAAISWDRKDGGDINLALGSHLDWKLALSRALSELNQMSVYQWTAESEESNYFARYEHELWKREATIYNQPFLAQLDYRTADPDAHAYSPGEDLRDDIQLVMDRLERAGLETIVLDLTREDCPLSVVRMIVPGLRHFWARYGPGRLYDVPVEMGWLSKPNSETELNPIPVFI